MLVLNDSAGQLLATVTRALAGHGLATSWEPGRPESSGPADGVATLVMDGMTCVLPFQIKAQLRPSTVGLLPATLSPGTLIVSQHVTTTVGELLRHQGLNYVDAAGNASVTAPGVRIRLEGFRPPAGSTTPSSVFTQATIPVILAILNRPELIHSPVRQLHARVKVSLGTVHKARHQLSSTGLDNTPAEDPSTANRRRWRGLLEGWVAAYTTRRESLILGRYSSPGPLHDLPRGAAVVSGELAAVLAGADLRPATADLYVDDTATDLIRAARLRPESNGPITVRRSIWTPAMLEDSSSQVPGLAPSPVIYADLASIIDPRTATIARDWIANDENLRSLLHD